MKKSGLKTFLSAGVSVLVIASAATTAFAQDASTKAGDSATADKDKKSNDSQVVIVTSRRKALKTAIDIKKNSDTIVDSIVADEAGQLPDTSITEVLSRVSGVTLSRFSTVGSSGTPSFQIEGTGISVRGLPYNSSTVNGRQAFSANGANGLSWGDVTPELGAGVDVYKASRADLIEGGTSSIDLKTRMPFDYKKPELDLSFGVSYGDQIKKTSPEASLLYTRRFDTSHGEMGFLIDLAHSRYESQDSDAQFGPYLMENDPNVASGQALVPTGYNWSQNTNKRDRNGFYAAFQWKPSDSLVLSSSLFFSQYQTSSSGHSGGWGNNPNGTNENIPTDATFDKAGAMQTGSLHVGGTGASTPVFGWNGNNWLYQYSAPQYWAPGQDYSYLAFFSTPLPKLLTADCRTQYGSLDSSSVNINWGNWDSPGQTDASGNIIPNTGMFYCQSNNNANGTITLSLGGNTTVSHNISSTVDFSNSFVWTPNDKLRVRGALQLVLSRTNGLSMYAALTQSDPNLSSASFDATKKIPTLGGFDAAALVNTSTAYFSQFAYNGNQNKGTSAAFNLDAEYKLDDDHFIKSVGFGVRGADRSERDDFVGTYWAPVAEGWVNVTYPDSTTGGYAPYLTGSRAISGPYQLQDTENGVTKTLTVTPYDTVKASDYSVFNFPNYFGGSVASPGKILVPSAALMQGYNWQHLAGLSADAYTDALNVAKCKAFPTLDICNPNSTSYVNPGSWSPAKYYKNSIDQNLGITNTALRNVAIYGEAKFGSNGVGFLPSFSGNFGLRVVRQILSGDGNIIVHASNGFYLNAGAASAALANGNNPTPVGDIYEVVPTNTTRTKSISFTRALPSFNVKFDLSSKLILRLAASEGISPPNLNDIRAGGQVTPATQDLKGVDPVTKQQVTVSYLKNMVSQSGSDMKPVMMSSGDMSLEWYPKDGEFAYLDLFGKELKDQDLYTYYYQTQATPLLKGVDKVPVTLNLPWFYQQNESIHKPAEISGFELGGRKFFDSLPSPFKGLGVNGSVTYVYSKNPSQLANSVVGPYVPDFVFKGTSTGGAGDVGAGNPNTDIKHLPYYGMSKWSYNVELYYSMGAINARLAYNWHSKQLLSTNANPLSFNATGGNPYTCTGCNLRQVYEMVPLWSDDAGYLDFGFDYKINDRVTFGVTASNLTNTASKTLQEPLPGVFERDDTYQSDRRASAYLRLRY